MKKPLKVPATLVQAIRYFADPNVCLSFLVNLRWPDGVRCPRCGSEKHSFITTRKIWKCAGCRKQFSVKVGTIFEDSPIALDRWLAALWMVVNSKNGISSYELARSLGITQKTAWFMLHRIRLATQTRSFMKMRGEVEADESFIGGKARNRGHALKRYASPIKRHNRLAMTAVMGLLERGPKGKSRVRTKVVPNVRRASLAPEIRQNVERGSVVLTDSLQSYGGLKSDYVHEVINHAESYARGRVHTNGLENFWCLLKRTIRGTYVSVEPFHLFRYLDEQAWRFNMRTMTDSGRFMETLGQIVGRRLTYSELTGADATA
ncbi:MAG: IS1595 family transposase [Candidatus Eisenbacteria bacterium]|nr:IS1595 family transposase [Candidatus Eisenbacteria bacterium]